MRAAGLLALLLLAACMQRREIPPPLRKVDASLLQAELASMRGRPLVLHFWATWCPPCLEELPRIVAAARRFRPQGVRFMVVVVEGPDQRAPIDRALERFGAPFDGLLLAGADSAAMTREVDPAWTGTLPATFFYDAKGTQVDKRIGVLGEQALVDAITRLLRR